MARPKEFDVDAALDRAMDLFWERGYEATSLKDLVERMGIGRQSLYDTFGDKRSLYLAALERYRRAVGQSLVAILERPGASLAEVRAVFDLAIEYGCAEDSGRACFMIHSAMERAAGDTEVAAAVRRYYSRIIEGIRGCLESAQRKGELDRRHGEPEAMAHALSAHLIGVSVLGKAGFSRQALSSGVDALFQALGRPS